jgi:hypothetical protein
VLKPLGAETPTGGFLMLVLTTDGYVGTSFGSSPRAYDLSSLGNVEILRDDA